MAAKITVTSNETRALNGEGVGRGLNLGLRQAVRVCNSISCCQSRERRRIRLIGRVGERKSIRQSRAVRLAQPTDPLDADGTSDKIRICIIWRLFY